MKCNKGVTPDVFLKVGKKIPTDVSKRPREYTTNETFPEGHVRSADDKLHPSCNILPPDTPTNETTISVNAFEILFL